MGKYRNSRSDRLLANEQSIRLDLLPPRANKGGGETIGSRFTRKTTGTSCSLQTRSLGSGFLGSKKDHVFRCWLVAIDLDLLGFLAAVKREALSLNVNFAHPLRLWTLADALYFCVFHMLCVFVATDVDGPFLLDRQRCAAGICGLQNYLICRVTNQWLCC